jgi:hypothetical protein
MEYPRKHSGNSLHKFKIKAATLTGNGFSMEFNKSEK